jgi:hypothetical protein
MQWEDSTMLDASFLCSYLQKWRVPGPQNNTVYPWPLKQSNCVSYTVGRTSRITLSLIRLTWCNPSPDHWLRHIRALLIPSRGHMFFMGCFHRQREGCEILSRRRKKQKPSRCGSRRFLHVLIPSQDQSFHLSPACAGGWTKCSDTRVFQNFYQGHSLRDLMEKQSGACVF